MPAREAWLGRIKRIVQPPRKRILLFIGVVVGGSALWLYLTEFYYDPGAYRLGIRNATVDTTFREVSLRLEPREQFEYGILVPGQAKWDMDPRTPTPTNAIVHLPTRQARPTRCSRQAHRRNFVAASAS